MITDTNKTMDKTMNKTMDNKHETTEIKGIYSFPDPEIQPHVLRQHILLLKHFEAFMDRFKTGNEELDLTIVRRVLIHATSRYALYLRLLALDVRIVPPWDVAIVMHTHLLNPSTFRNDLQHYFPNLLDQRMSFPLQQLVDCIESGDDKNSISAWNEYYPESLFYTVLENPSHLVYYDCPFCDCQVSTSLYNMERVIADKTDPFTFPCSNCGVQGNADIISAKRFLQDCYKLMQDDSYTLSGLYVEPSPSKELVKFMIYDGSKTQFGNLVEQVHEGTIPSWTLIIDTHSTNIKLFRQMRKLRFVNVQWFKMIVKSYRGYIFPFSVSLPEAVFRQRSFSQKITSCGIQDSLPDLELCRFRYHRWFHILEKNVMRVPTLNIDLAWHTHQLFPCSYYDWCQHTVGRFINHDDNIETPDLNRWLRLTATKWYQEYNEPYMVDDANTVTKFWTEKRVAKSIFLPGYVFYAWKKKKLVEKSFWKGTVGDELFDAQEIGERESKDRMVMYSASIYPYYPIGYPMFFYGSSCGGGLGAGCAGGGCNGGMAACGTGACVSSGGICSSGNGCASGCSSGCGSGCGGGCGGGGCGGG